MKRLSISQKALVVILYLLIVLMVFFSFQALKNLGNEGYQNCIQEKCETQGEQYCTKFREVTIVAWAQEDR